MEIRTDLKLVTISYTNDGYGKKVATETKTQIQCKKESITQSEFFSSFNAGFKPTYKLTVYDFEYAGQTICELYEGGVWVKYDIYRTYQDGIKTIELWVTKKNTSVPYVVTLFTDKVVKLHNVYLSGQTGANDTSTGRTSTDNVVLVLPQDLKAFVGETQVSYARPKAYSAMDSTAKATHFTMDSSSYFVLGDKDPTGTYNYQSINSTYDDVYRIASVSFVNRGLDTEYMEVVGK